MRIARPFDRKSYVFGRNLEKSDPWDITPLDDVTDFNDENGGFGQIA